MLYYVNYLLDEGADIFTQIKLLKNNLDNEQVKLYLNELDKCNLSPYIRWVVDKYLFDRKVGKEPSDKTQNNLFKIFVKSYEDNNKKIKISFYVKEGDIVVIKKGIFAGNQGKVLFINNNDIIIKLNILSKIKVEKLTLDYIGGVYYE